MKSLGSLLLGLLLKGAILQLALVIAPPIQAQITVDGTTDTSVTPIDNGIRIDAGNRTGDNLFHSFQEFSVVNGSEAFFNNANDIVNIFSRVTGGNISNIDGLIRANGEANLFLINPAGIIFGEGASLDLGGSFLGSSASSILFPDGIEFNATDSENPPLLTINAPLGLGLQDNPGEIINRSIVQNSAEEFVGLEVAPGNNLALIGGQINFERGQATARGGNIKLGGLSQAGTVGINEDGSLSFPDGIARADVTLTNAANVNVRGGGGGSITVNARNIELSGGESGRSFLLAGIAENSGSTTAQAGDIILNATDTISVSQESIIANQVVESVIGNAGRVDITTTDLSLREGSFISASTFGQGNAGAIKINATDTISFNNSSIFSRVGGESVVGNSGGINITTGSLQVTNGARVNASTAGEGNAGQVKINADGAVSLDGVNQLPTAVLSNVEVRATGNSGGVTIIADSLSVTNGALVESRTRGSGDAADVDIQVHNGITLNGLNSSNIDNSGVYSGVENGAIGQGGDIRIDTGSLLLQDGARIENSTLGQ
ncbi:MAG: filamentous hemagglutinin N-terminal domain-containing protein, partial [Pleurocapsa sp. MO_226.B13]|nr:filamentous hemagglutinin N-terminal domain-containing protein [Pleurocapsa sp. MO_226.B13]